MTTGSTSPGGVPARRTLLNRRVLVSNLVSGTFWVLVLLVLGAWPLAVLAAAYVVLASLLLAAVYAREGLTAKQEAVAWTATWLGAVAAWAVLLGLAGLGLGLLLGTLCCLAWQALAQAVRQGLAWRLLRR